MTTITVSQNEMSTVLPLLPYAEVMEQLEYYNDATPRTDATHVAVLNHRPAKYPHGAFCLLLNLVAGHDITVRLQTLPAILPDLRDLVSQLQTTMVLDCADLTA
jgi:hypothetical protein